MVSNADNVEILDLKGKMILPAFIDAHTHIGLSVMMDGDDDSIPMWDCQSKQEILERTEHIQLNWLIRIMTGMLQAAQ